MAQTLYDKLMAAHVVREEATTALIYIDRQLIHEVTSPQAFEGLEMAGRKPWRLDANLAVPDHNVPTTDRSSGVTGIKDPISKIQIETLDKNCEIFGINEITMNDVRQGIVHVVGPDNCGADIPRWLRSRLDDIRDDEQAVKAFGEEVVTRLCERLLAMGAPGLHFYTMNQSGPILRVLDNLGL